MKSNNIVSRIFERQIRNPAPGTSFNCARRFYENLVPSCTIYNVECPDHSFRKFTDDGQFLISFSRNHQDLIVYRPTWLSFSCKDEDCDSDDLPSKAKRFESFFTQLYCVSLASSNEFICKDFFLYVESNQFGLFATQTAQTYDAPTVEGAIHGVPSVEKITFHLVRLQDGVVLDEKIFCNDFVNLAHSMGVFLYDDLLAIMSLRYQTIHILQIRDSGNLVDVRAIGAFCREDDELFLNSHAQYMAISDKSKQQEVPGNQAENGLQHHQQIPGSSFLSGIKQRLLSFIFHGIWNDERDHSLRAQCLKKNFYFHFQDYVDLIMWKVQFLDRHHLLIKFGSVDGGVSRNTDHHPAFFAVYNMETTEFIAFYQNSADELYHLFEQFCDHFHATSRNLLYMNFISSHSNNVYALEQLRSTKSKAGSFTQFVKKMMTSLPFSCQSQSPSPYFDQSLFRFDEKLISATDRHRQSTEHPIKFISRRHPNTLKFKIKPVLPDHPFVGVTGNWVTKSFIGNLLKQLYFVILDLDSRDFIYIFVCIQTGPEAGGADGQTKKISSFLFHPIFPLALSIQHTLLQPSVVNIHFRR
ncbi:De-etiolated protein 1 [Macleaya cordata]|uniref:De-etiolated protein 1 n=1 Tax=Macleaya cordata TaxID=56857 RepID=A0A200PP76_MACCD|nr:De-etiolated protein 1 [Macleaya cordata]